MARSIRKHPTAGIGACCDGVASASPLAPPRSRASTSSPRAVRALLAGTIVVAVAVGTPLACSSNSKPSTPGPTTPASPDVSAPGPEDSSADDVTGATDGNGVGGRPPDTFAPTTTAAP